MLIMSKQKVEYLSDEELKDFIPIVTKAIESICKLSDKHNFDRNSMFKYFANHISAMSEIATIENYSFEEAKE